MNLSHKNIVQDSWLGEIIKRPAYKLILDDEFCLALAKDSSDERSMLKELQSHPVFIYARIPDAQLSNGRLLEGFGFYLVDTNIILEKAIDYSFIDPEEFIIRFSQPSDEAGVAELARGAFIYSRFHQDKAFSKELADTIKSEWARNFFRGKRGDYMVVAEHKGEIRGFLQLLKAPTDLLIIDLIAVSQSSRRRGIAQSMIEFAQFSCKGFRLMRVGTQVINLASRKLYERLGLRPVEISHVYHFHNRG